MNQGHFLSRFHSCLKGAAVFFAGMMLAPVTYAAEVQWEPRTPMSVKRSQVAVASDGTRLYAIAGTLQAEGKEPQWASTLNLSYDPATDTWKDLAPLPQPLTHVGATFLDGKIYAVGGFTNIIHMNPSNVAFAYDIKTNTWTGIPAISHPRGSVSVIAANGKVHAIGGRHSREVGEIPLPFSDKPMLQGIGTDTSHQIYDPKTGIWTNAEALPGPGRDHLAVVEVNGRIHVIGGRLGGYDENVDRHDVFDPATGKWSESAALPQPRSAGATTVVDGKILYAGGECGSDNRAFEEAFLYDPATNKWASVANLPEARHGNGAATANGTAYFLAGGPACGDSTTREILAVSIR